MKKQMKPSLTLPSPVDSYGQGPLKPSDRGRMSVKNSKTCQNGTKQGLSLECQQLREDTPKATQEYPAKSSNQSTAKSEQIALEVLSPI